MKQLYYTGVGSRQTPPHILKLMGVIAQRLQDMGIILRTGDAAGADAAFRNHCLSKVVYTAKDILQSDHPSVQLALDMAEDIHPNWHAMGEYAQALHARNCYQVLGPGLNYPSEFLICWTLEGRPLGGTRTAIVLAHRNKVPVFNLGLPNGLGELTMFIKMQPWYVAPPAGTPSLSHSHS